GRETLKEERERRNSRNRVRATIKHRKRRPATQSHHTLGPVWVAHGGYLAMLLSVSHRGSHRPIGERKDLGAGCDRNVRDHLRHRICAFSLHTSHATNTNSNFADVDRRRGNCGDSARSAGGDFPSVYYSVRRLLSATAARDHLKCHLADARDRHNFHY